MSLDTPQTDNSSPNDSQAPDRNQQDTFTQSKLRSDRIWQQIDQTPERFRMLTGDRPTGALHLGHYFGTLANRVDLQNKGVETFVVIADYQVLTDRDSVQAISEHVGELILDYLACGLDPLENDRTTIFCHSHIPELNQLLLPFLTLVSVPELERNPTVKEELSAAKLKTMSASMLTYPVHQAADILFCKGQIVPVGKDQLPHLEMSRKIARRFNERFCPKQPLFPEPDALLAEVPHILGLDGNAKMSKSRQNAIEIRHTADQTLKAIKKAKTDSDRHITYDPDHRPEVANLLRLLSLCTGGVRSPQAWAEDIGDRGSGHLKLTLAEAINEHFAPIREKRKTLASEPHLVQHVLRQGCENARERAQETLSQVRKAMNMDYAL